MFQGSSYPHRRSFATIFVQGGHLIKVKRRCVPREGGDRPGWVGGHGIKDGACFHHAVSSQVRIRNISHSNFLSSHQHGRFFSGSSSCLINFLISFAHTTTLSFRPVIGTSCFTFLTLLSSFAIFHDQIPLHRHRTLSLRVAEAVALNFIPFGFATM